jgi:uncharacterized protein YecE (DUF72 family)
MRRIRVGTSGYVYAHWKNLLYEGVPAPQWLERYAQVFDTVELNATFYRLPSASMVDGWRARSPRGFLFACKGSRYLTHMKRLTDPGPGLDRYFEVVLRLREKLGPILWQLPPQMTRPDAARLDAFLHRVPQQLRHAVEFRSAGWYTDEICEVLDSHGAAFCEHDLVDRSPPRLTGRFRYLRFHGATGKYQGRYAEDGLAPFARDLLGSRREAWVYFNNDVGGHAILDARALLRLTGHREAGASAGASP